MENITSPGITFRELGFTCIMPTVPRESVGGQRDAVHRLHQPARREQRVAAQVHRRRAGVRVHADHACVEPALAERAGHGADGDARVLEHRALFDVRFEIRAQRAAAHRRRAAIADGIERFAER